MLLPEKNNALKIVRTTSEAPDHAELLHLLEAELMERYRNEPGIRKPENPAAEINQVLIAYFEGIPVGCSGFKKYSADCAELIHMFVKKEYRNKGIAQVLLKELENWVAEAGFKTAIFETGKKQPEAMHLYERMGYTRTANFHPENQSSLTVCMIKKL